MITTEDKTLQEVSDEIAAALIAQGKRCMSIEGRCAYGDNQGNHCAVGWLLPPERDDLMAYIGGVPTLVDTFEDLGPNDEFIREHVELLSHIQDAHDASSGVRLHNAIARSLNAAFGNNDKYSIAAWTPWIELRTQQEAGEQS